MPVLPPSVCVAPRQLNPSALVLFLHGQGLHLPFPVSMLCGSVSSYSGGSLSGAPPSPAVVTAAWRAVPWPSAQQDLGRRPEPSLQRLETCRVPAGQWAVVPPRSPHLSALGFLSGGPRGWGELQETHLSRRSPDPNQCLQGSAGESCAVCSSWPVSSLETGSWKLPTASPVVPLPAWGLSCLGGSQPEEPSVELRH